MNLISDRNGYILSDISLSVDPLSEKEGFRKIIYTFYSSSEILSVATDYSGDNPKIFTEIGVSAGTKFRGQIPDFVIDYGIEKLLTALYENENYKKYKNSNPDCTNDFDLNVNKDDDFGWEWQVFFNCYGDEDIETLSFSINPEKNQVFLSSAKKTDFDKSKTSNPSVNNEFYFIKYPIGWTLLDYQKMEISDFSGGFIRNMKVGPNLDGSFPLINIFSIKSDQNSDIHSIKEMLIEAKNSLIKDGWKVYAEGDFDYNLSDGKSATGKQLKAELGSKKKWVIYILRNDNMIRFSYENNSTNFEDGMGIVNKMLSSWKIN